jgi:hypothetical protein
MISKCLKKLGPYYTQEYTYIHEEQGTKNNSLVPKLSRQVAVQKAYMVSVESEAEIVVITANDNPAVGSIA